MKSIIFGLFLFFNIALARPPETSNISPYEYLQCLLATSAGILYRRSKEKQLILNLPAIIFFIGEVIVYFYITAFFIVPYMYQLQENVKFSYLKMSNCYVETLARTTAFFVVANFDITKIFEAIKR